ncbi:MAG: type III secretion system chaperone [Paracoccaceae bacterium]
MNDANHALDLLARKLSLSDLRFDDDQAGIALPEGPNLFLTRLDEQTIEASCQLEGLDYPDAAMMRAMLEANFLGGATGPGRLALDADKSEVVLCECWMVTDHDAASLERRFDAFVAAALFWCGEGTAILLEQAATIRAETAGPATTFAEMNDEDGEVPVLMRL